MTRIDVRSLVTPRQLSEIGTLSTRVIGLVAGLATSGITARALSPEGRGEYFYVIAIAAIVGSVANLGLSSANGFFSARNPQLVRRLTVWSLAASGALGLLGATVFALAARIPAFEGLGTRHEGVLLVLTPLTLALVQLSPLLAGQHRFGALNLIQLGQQLGLLTACILIALWAPSPEAFLFANSTVVLLGVLAMTLCARAPRDGAAAASAGDVNVTAVEWVNYGARAYVILMLGTLLSRLGVVFVKTFADPEALGIYSVSMQVWDSLSILPSALALILFPTVVRDGTLSWEKCLTEVQRMGLIALAAAGVSAIAMYPAIRIVFGADYVDAIYPGLLFLPGFVGLSVLTATSQFLAGIGFPRWTTFNWMIAIIILAVLGPLFVSRWGASGGAAATSVTHIILAALMLNTARRELPRSGEPARV